LWRRLGRWLGLLALLPGGLAAAVLLVLPWLARRGDLNSFVEGFLASSLSVPVRIGKIESHPLESFTVTELRSVAVEAKRRLEFSASAVSILYDPLEVFSGRVRELRLTAPNVAVNLDGGLGSLLSSGAPGGGEETAEDRSGEDLLPMTIGLLVLEGGTLTLELGGRPARLSSLQLEAREIGKRRGQELSLSADAFGGRVRAKGALDVLPAAAAAGGGARYAVRSAELAVEDMDLAGLLAWLAPTRDLAAVLPRGRISLEGWARGTWPEEIEIELSSRASGLEAAMEEAAVEDALVSLKLGMAVSGLLERVTLSVSGFARGTLTGGAEPAEQSGSLLFHGAFERRPQGGVLTVAPLRIELDDLAELRATGSVSPVLGDEPPALDLAVTCERIDLRAAIARLPLPAQAGSLLAPLDGELSLGLDLEGRLGAPVAGGRFTLAALRYSTERGKIPLPEAAGSFRGLELGGAAAGPPRAAGRLLEALELEAARLETTAFDASHAPALAAAVLAGLGSPPPPFLASLELGGKWGFELGAEEIGKPGGPLLRGQATWSAGEVTALDRAASGATGIEARVGIEARIAPGERRASFRLDGGLGLDEILAGAFYARPAGSALELSARGEALWREDRGIEAFRLEELRARAPFTGPLSASGTLARSAVGGAAESPAGGAGAAGAAGLWSDFRLEASAVPVAEALRLLALEDLVPGLEGAHWGGTAALDVVLRGPLPAPGVRGTLRLRDGELAFPGASGGTGTEGGEGEGRSVRIEGAALELPLAAGSFPGDEGAPLRRGFLLVPLIRRGAVEVTDVHLPFRFEKGTYTLAAPFRQDLFGGRLELRAAEVTPGSPLSVRVGLLAEGLVVERLARDLGASGWEIPGTLDVHLEPLLLRGGDLEALGSLTLNAFGGRVELSDLRARHLLEPYARISLARGRIDGLSLRELGETFHFGLASGVLRGAVEDVEITGGELSRFSIDAAAVPRPGVPQWIDRRAIESLSTVLSGPFGTIEETFFSRFRFARFGFHATLHDGEFRLRGTSRADDPRYLMHAHWYQLPRISILHNRPDQAYGWEGVLSNLGRVYERGEE
jgi:hypothetical protein